MENETIIMTAAIIMIVTTIIIIIVTFICLSFVSHQISARAFF